MPQAKEIIEFTFEQHCYCDIMDTYNFYKHNDKYFLTYAGMKPFSSSTIVEIQDFNAFNEKILSIIKPWKRKYYPEFNICDSLIWKFNVKLSNRKYFIHYNGHHETPDNYYELEEFLDKFFN